MKYGNEGNSRNIQQFDAEVISEKVITPTIYILELIEKIIDKTIVMIQAGKDFIVELKRNRMSETIDTIGDMLIHRTMLRDLRKMGLTGDWYKLIVNKGKHGVWLKNTSDIYVAINRNLFDKLKLKEYGQILGTDTEGLRRNVETSEGINFLNTCGFLKSALGPLVKKNEGVISESEDHKVFKYVITNDNEEPIAIFGMVFDEKNTTMKDRMELRLVFEEEIREILSV